MSQASLRSLKRSRSGVSLSPARPAPSSPSRDEQQPGVGLEALPHQDQALAPHFVQSDLPVVVGDQTPAAAADAAEPRSEPAVVLIKCPSPAAVATRDEATPHTITKQHEEEDSHVVADIVVAHADEAVSAFPVADQAATCAATESVVDHEVKEQHPHNAAVAVAPQAPHDEAMVAAADKDDQHDGTQAEVVSVPSLDNEAQSNLVTGDAVPEATVEPTDASVIDDTTREAPIETSVAVDASNVPSSSS